MITTMALSLMLNIVPFDTDFCTMWREGTRQDPLKWSQCCVMHDLNYWAGGTKKDRKNADKDLKACVSKVHNNRMGRLMYTGVRAGRLSPIKVTGQGWAYAWKQVEDRSKHKSLSKEEILLLRDELYIHHPHVEPKTIDIFIAHLKARVN